MKRSMTEPSDIFSGGSLGDALAVYTKRSRITKPKLVDDCDKLAEKVEPGYLIKLAENIERANDFVLHSACGKLKVIEDQMSYLKRQALDILVETKVNSVLHSLACNFPKKTGHTYSVYQKLTGEYYFSMLSPAEWGCSTPHEYIGTFRLEGGQSWSPVDDFSKTSALRHWIQSQNESMMIE